MRLPLVLPVILCSLTLGNAEVMKDTFKRKNPKGCSEFFYKKKAPTGILPPKPARICQVYENKAQFATMYDRDLRIPLYSAYVYERGERVDTDWMIEPQLVDPKNSKAMEDEVLTRIDREKLADSQAVNADYDGSGYDRGHLNPAGHHREEAASAATFTLTNIVPQASTLNQGPWENYERDTMTRETNVCQKTYAIVGVIPGEETISNGRVNVPSKIWAAACCVTAQNRLKSWAVIADNVKTGTVDPITIENLQKEIGKYTKRCVRLFHKDCPRNTLSNYFELEDENSLWPINATDKAQ